MLSKGDIVLLLDDSPDAGRGRRYAKSFYEVARELGLEGRFYLAAGGTLPRQTETEFLNDLRCANVVVLYLATVNDAKSEVNRAGRVLLNVNNLRDKHVLVYSDLANADTAWLGSALTSGGICDEKSFEAALRQDLKRLTGD